MFSAEDAPGHYLEDDSQTGYETTDVADLVKQQKVFFSILPVVWNCAHTH